MGWRTPTGHYDPDGQWIDETKAYDNNFGTYAYDDVSPTSWGSFLELTIGEIPCGSVRFYAEYGGEFAVNSIDLDVYYSGTWHDVYQGSYLHGTWVEKTFGAGHYVSKARVKFYNSGATPSSAVLFEFNFHETSFYAPTVTTQACTDITGYSAKGNGNITSTGGATVTTRGFCYMPGTSGDPTTANSKVYDTGSFGTGAFSKTIPNLSPSTNYRVRAYAINSEGTSYGATVQLTTSSPPTVTTQAVSDILSITATGNGNITATGGQTPTKRGVCWNTTGSPTVADSKSEETGSFGTGAFTRPITGLSPGTLYYVKAYAYSSAGYGYGAEVEFTTLKVAPTVTVQTPTDILPTTVTANGNITALGGENATIRGFKYGLTKTDTWDEHDTDEEDGFTAGAYTKGLTLLTANTTYWIQAYATNSIGTSYSEWIEFQTAAVGIIPTGTKIDICSDYSGYSYKLQRSETDDGEAYTAYFVISTDLTDKQALAFYKRILDLHLYFRNEDSGTVTIEVKRDSEVEWQSVGSVSLEGDEDIIVKHLAPDIRAKHFLFKISAANRFRFLGCLYEYIPEGMR